VGFARRVVCQVQRNNFYYLFCCVAGCLLRLAGYKCYQELLPAGGEILGMLGVSFYFLLSIRLSLFVWVCVF
jgi:hypothetical protein